MRQPYVVPRHRLVFAVWLTVLALPLLVLDNIPKTEARAAAVKVDAVRVVETTTSTAPTTTTATTVVESTTVATEATTPETAPATTAPNTTPKPKPVAVREPAPTSSTTTTTTAPPNTEQGGASWYDYRPGECAHRTLPKGTVVTIRSLENGATTTCVVTDRGPYESGRIIDLDRATFAELKDPALGVVQVEISW